MDAQGMKISIVNSPYDCSKYVVANYYDTHGTPKTMQTKVTDIEAMNSPVNILEQAKIHLTRKVQQDVERSMGMGTVDYPSYYSQVRYTANAGTLTTNSWDGTTTALDNSMYYTTATINYDYPGSWQMTSSKRSIKIKFKSGKRTLIIEKDLGSDDVEVTPEDIEKAKVDYIRDARINIITRKADRKAEDLLKMFVSEIDFRSYKENGYFTVKNGNRLFRIWKDNHKFVDVWEKDKGVFKPKNRLCTHTKDRSLPLADEVVQKLMLIKTNRIVEFANSHPIDNSMSELKEDSLILV